MSFSIDTWARYFIQNVGVNCNSMVSDIMHKWYLRRPCTSFKSYVLKYCPYKPLATYLLLLASKNSIHLYSRIVRTVDFLSRNTHTKVLVRTPCALINLNKTLIKKHLHSLYNHSTLIYKEVIDTTVIAGIVIEINSRVIDGSLRTLLNR